MLTFQLDRAAQKSRMDLKQLAKKGDVKSARILARELVRANKQRDRLMSSQARVKSVQMQLQHQLCELFSPLAARPKISRH
jgi:charged multivesicular body protein 3